MAENEKEHGFMSLLKDGLNNVFHVISAIISPSISESIESIIKDIEVQIEKRIMKKIYTISIIALGGIFLIFALFFFLIESFGWSKSAASFSIGITVFVIGLLLKVGGESNK